jgi:hypothetical protein
MELTREGVRFSPEEIRKYMPLLRRAFPKGSLFDLERQDMSKRLHEEDESGLMDGTSPLREILDDFYERAKKRLSESNDDQNLNRSQFMFFAMHVDDDQLED